MRCLLVVTLVLTATASAHAEVIKPNLRCGGPPLEWKDIKVLDLQELPQDEIDPFVLRTVGPIEIVKRETLEMQTAMGSVEKKAAKQSAFLGCPIVIILDQESVNRGGVVLPQSGLIAPRRRRQVSVVYARPQAEAGTEQTEQN